MREARERGISGTCQVLIEKEGVGISRVGAGVGVCGCKSSNGNF